MAWDYVTMFKQLEVKSKRSSNSRSDTLNAFGVSSKEQLQKIAPFYLDVPVNRRLIVYTRYPIIDKQEYRILSPSNQSRLQAIPFLCCETLGLGTIFIKKGGNKAYMTRLVHKKKIYRLIKYINGEKAVREQILSLLSFIYLLYNGQYNEKNKTLQLPIYYDNTTVSDYRFKVVKESNRYQYKSTFSVV